MPLPLIPVAIAGLGIAGGYGISSFLGGTKKEASINYAPVYSPTSSVVDARQSSYQYSPQYAVQISSPEASITKKDALTADLPMSLKPSVDGARTTQDMSSGTDMTKLAIIGVIGLVAYGLVSKK
jgi:hypothetical protein